MMCRVISLPGLEGDKILPDCFRKINGVQFTTLPDLHTLYTALQHPVSLFQVALSLTETMVNDYEWHLIIVLPCERSLGHYVFIF